MSETQKAHQVGNKVIIRRGEYRNQEGRVIGVAPDGELAVQFPDATMTMVKPANVREPAVQTYTAKDVAEVVQALVNRGTDRGLDSAQAFLDEAEDAFPGLRDLVSWPVREASEAGPDWPNG